MTKRICILLLLLNVFTYSINSEELRNGFVTETYPNGKVKTDKHYQNGKLDGICMYYYEDGKIQAEEHYVNDLKEGTQKMYSRDHKLWLVENYKNGKPNGSVKSYDMDGLIAQEDYYIDGKKDGQSKLYKKGKLVQETTYKNDKMLVDNSSTKKYSAKDFVIDNKKFMNGKDWQSFNTEKKSLYISSLVSGIIQNSITMSKQMASGPKGDDPYNNNIVKIGEELTQILNKIFSNESVLITTIDKIYKDNSKIESPIIEIILNSYDRNSKTSNPKKEKVYIDGTLWSKSDAQNKKIIFCGMKEGMFINLILMGQGAEMIETKNAQLADRIYEVCGETQDFLNLKENNRDEYMKGLDKLYTDGKNLSILVSRLYELFCIKEVLSKEKYSFDEEDYLARARDHQYL